MYPHVGIDASGLAVLRRSVAEILKEVVPGLREAVLPREQIQAWQYALAEDLGGRWRPVPVGAPASLTPEEQRKLRRLPHEPWVLVRSAEAARDRLLADGTVDGVAVFVGELGLRGRSWHEAFGIALINDWQIPRGPWPERHVCNLLADAEHEHLQLTPLWRRRARGQRVLLLDSPLGDGATLYDFISSPDGDPLENMTGVGFDNPRLARVLNGLTPRELRVAEAFAHHRRSSWADAAACAGEPDPAAFGKTVQRKLTRLMKEATRRSAQQHTHPCGLSLPAPRGGQA
ncbi:hypothetical protein ABZY09_35220 [Streptomyces sp. NPDC002928]|uniref:hypothetical protein n=1 Tax=Streptomyces sp. NPDC002928 TaxID=3154440 RepID=UPI0033A09125